MHENKEIHFIPSIPIVLKPHHSMSHLLTHQILYNVEKCLNCEISSEWETFCFQSKLSISL